jgi:uncharacterized membrane protein YidH (DUF202 family)
MTTDIRFPIGLLFSILGVVITAFGLFTRGSEIYRHSLNININLYTGACLIVFGVFMLVMALRGQKKDKAKPQ